MYHATKFADALNIHSQGEKITTDEHQLLALAHVMQCHRALFVSPTASGKSLIAYLLFRQLNDYKKLRGLMIVPSTGLVEQMTSDFVDYSSENGFDVRSNINKIYDFKGMTKHSDKALTIATWQSIHKMPDEYFEQFDYVIGDEAHLFKADSLVGIVAKCVNAKYRIGMTGTLDGTKTHKLVLEGLFGPFKQFITTREMMDAKKAAPINIKCIVLKHPKEQADAMVKGKYPDELKYLINCHERNKFIRNLALSLDKNVLILFQMVDKHGKLLYDMISTAEKLNGRKVYYIHGGIDTEDREEIRKIVETEKNAIILASYGTTSTGTNIRNLHYLIFASPSKSKIRVLQSIGRTIRRAKDKDNATLYDIADDMRSKKYINHTLKHFVDRTNIYNQEQFPYKIYKIGLKDD
jgi:superfamily II DNA or RNA helicase